MSGPKSPKPKAPGSSSQGISLPCSNPEPMPSRPCVCRLIRLTSKSPTFDPIVAWLLILMPKNEIWCLISLPNKIAAFARSRFKSLTLASQPCVVYFLTVFTVFDTWTLTLVVTRARAAPLKRQCWTAWTLLVTVGVFRYWRRITLITALAYLTAWLLRPSFRLVAIWS